MFPTPTASDATGGPNKVRVQNGKLIRDAGTIKHSANLQSVVKAWPTPTVSMHKGATLKPRKDGRVRDDRMDYAVAQQEGLHNGQLNPMWVEWLMGYPLGWTELSPSEMPSSRKSQRR